MKTIAFLSLMLIAGVSLSQEEVKPCTGLPIAKPEVHAVCETTDLPAFFEQSLPQKLKAGTHAAVYKLTVDCHGTVTDVLYQRGTLDSKDQPVFADQLKALVWKPAQQKNVAVTSFVFVSLEIVNGRVTSVVVQ